MTPRRFTNRGSALIALIVVLCLASAATGLAQRGFRFYIPPNTPPPTELVVARWKFSTNGRIGHRGWTHNYPSAELHLNQMIGSVTVIDVKPMSYKIVDLATPEVFNFPFSYVSEPGEMELTEQELLNLRQYIDRGGFIVVDDFDGPWQFDQFRRQLQRAFPERSLFPLTSNHEVFHTFFDVNDLTIWAPYVPGADPIFYGFNNSNGDLAIVACFNNDFANFWDWIDQGVYPLKPSSEAFRMGVNFVIYSMTH